MIDEPFAAGGLQNNLTWPLPGSGVTDETVAGLSVIAIVVDAVDESVPRYPVTVYTVAADTDDGVPVIAPEQFNDNPLGNDGLTAQYCGVPPVFETLAVPVSATLRTNEYDAELNESAGGV